MAALPTPSARAFGPIACHPAKFLRCTQVSSCSTGGHHWINGGILLFRPSMLVATRLTRMARFAAWPFRGFFSYGYNRFGPPNPKSWVDICSPVDDVGAFERLFPASTNAFRDCRVAHHGAVERSRMPLACEKTHTDQSVLNHFFRRAAPHNGGHNITELDAKYNVGWRQGQCTDHEASEACGATASIVHFVGEPKPWSTSGKPPWSKIGEYWRRRWSESCPLTQVDALMRKRAVRAGGGYAA